MWFSVVTLNNVRSFKGRSQLELSRAINVLVGPNNSGKSTIVKALYLLQNNNALTARDARVGTKSGSSVEVAFEGSPADNRFQSAKEGRVVFDLQPQNSPILFSNKQKFGFATISAREPDNIIFPFLSKRKVVGYGEAVDQGSALSVLDNFEYLYAKIDRVSNRESPSHEFYREACRKLLGFNVSCVPSEKGKKAAYVIDDYQNIAIDAMGEGVVNILGLLVNLAVADGKIFLVEEPENDIHPKALKSLIRLIVEKSATNQFIVTTHSNIVTKYLGCEPESRIFEVTQTIADKLPVSTVRQIDSTPEARRAVLEDLGYDLADLDLWSAWLILEESSAEKIVREHLIRWFYPKLQGKLRTFSAGGKDQVEPKFESFNITFCFLHLQPFYKNRAWIIIDGGEEEQQILERLKEKYKESGWTPANFHQFKEHDFEKYYPPVFSPQVKKVLAEPDKDKKRVLKRGLLAEVEKWVKDHEEEAKKAFKESAAEVIGILKEIETQVSH